MGYISGSSSVSSSFSKGRGQETLATVLDNKYLKRRSQIEMQRRHQMESALCPTNQCMQLHDPRNKNYTVLVVIAILTSLCFSFYIAGWITSSYNIGSITSAAEEDAKLHSLAESLQRMRLRRQQALLRTGGGDSNDQQHHDEERNHHQLDNNYNHKNNEDQSEDIENEGFHRFEHIEERIRETHQKEVKEELRAERLDNTMAKSIEALKHYKEKEVPNKVPDVENESFT